MLILTRKVDECIVISDNITITILEAGNIVRLGIDAPRDIGIHREEVYRRIAAETASGESHYDTDRVAMPDAHKRSKRTSEAT